MTCALLHLLADNVFIIAYDETKMIVANELMPNVTTELARKV